MRKITALIHTHNDAQRIGRLLETLRPCDEVLVIDHGSTDNTRKVVGQYGANFKSGVPGVNRGVYAIDARHDWIFCLLPNEALSETLEAALFEWKQREELPDDDEQLVAKLQTSFSMHVREETESGWKEVAPQVRLVNRKLVNWEGDLPPDAPETEVLAGDVLRFRHP